MRQVCGLDIHKDSVFACIVNENGVVFHEKFGVLTPELEQLASVLQEHEVNEVCMESTSIYWMPVWRVLEPYVVELKLVNPYFIKQWKENGCQGCGVDSDLSAEGSYPRQPCTCRYHPATPSIRPPDIGPECRVRSQTGQT